MLIKSLSVEGVGRFATAAHVDGFGDGVNVLAAGNEVGKSTLFRSVRTCLFLRHDTKNQEIRDLASDDSQLPATIQLSFVRNGRTYGIKKSFLRSPCAILTEDGREIARGKQADEGIWDLLGVGPGSGRTIDDGAFGLLWVGQGGSFAAPVPGVGATSVLNAAIELEVGSLVGGERARQVLDQVSAELNHHLTDMGRPKSEGPLNQAQRSVDRWQIVEAEAQAKLAALEQQFTELLQHRRRRAEITDPTANAQFAQDLVEAKDSLSKARAITQEIRRLEAEDTGARRAVEASAQRLQQHRDVVARIDANRASETALNAALPDQRAREHEARTGLARTTEQLAAGEIKLRALSTRERQLEKLTGAVLRAQRKDDLARQLTAIEEAAEQLWRSTLNSRKSASSPRPSKTSTHWSARSPRWMRSLPPPPPTSPST